MKNTVKQSDQLILFRNRLRLHFNEEHVIIMIKRAVAIWQWINIRFPKAMYVYVCMIVCVCDSCSSKRNFFFLVNCLSKFFWNSEYLSHENYYINIQIATCLGKFLLLLQFIHMKFVNHLNILISSRDLNNHVIKKQKYL